VIVIITSWTAVGDSKTEANELATTPTTSWTHHPATKATAYLLWAKKNETNAIFAVRAVAVEFYRGVLQTPQQELNAVFTVADSFGECEGWRMLKKGAAAACSNTTIVELQW